MHKSRKKIIISLASIIVLLLASATQSFAYEYHKKNIDATIVHIIRLHFDEYEAQLIKANPSHNPKHHLGGREKVSSMAKRSRADLAINAGFFNIDNLDNLKDGTPTGSLVIHGKPYNLRKNTQALVIIHNGLISIAHAKPSDYLDAGDSLVSGIPMLINHGIISKNLMTKKGDFYNQPHARTAVGLDAHGNLVIVVAEHHYTKDLLNISLGDVQSLLLSKGQILAKKYKNGDLSNMTLQEVKNMLKEEVTAKNSPTQGLTIIKLARLMHELGCQYAVNLDGGGSSTLWMRGKVMNTIFGDADEHLGDKLERPVSDALIFKLKKREVN